MSINQHIRMISGGSCDTEDWSCENSALQNHTSITLKKIYSKMEKSYLK